MLSRLKKRLFTILDAIEGVNSGNRSLMLSQSDFNQMKRIMVR